MSNKATNLWEKGKFSTKYEARASLDKTRRGKWLNEKSHSSGTGWTTKFNDEEIGVTEIDQKLNFNSAQTGEQQFDVNIPNADEGNVEVEFDPLAVKDNLEISSGSSTLINTGEVGDVVTGNIDVKNIKGNKLNVNITSSAIKNGGETGWKLSLRLKAIRRLAVPRKEKVINGFTPLN